MFSPQDDTEIGANSTYSSQYGGVVQSSAPLMEGLQSVLKQRDGEVQQLQWEIHRLQTERNFLSNEITNLTVELEKVKKIISTFQYKFHQKLFVNFRLRSKLKQTK